VKWKLMPYPRKILEFKTAEEMFNLEMAA
jgi:IS30 family transposase